MRAGPWFRLLVALHPRRFREEHGSELLETVLSEWNRPADDASVRARAFLTLSADLLGSALRLHLRPVVPGAGGLRSRGGTALLVEVRQAARSLTRAPLFTGVTVTTLAVAVGTNTAVFSVVDSVLLRPLEYEDPERLVHVEASLRVEEGTRTHTRVSGRDVEAVRVGVPAFSDVAGVTSIRQNLTGTGPPAQVEVGWASANLFDLLGVDAEVGRLFTAEDPPGTVLLTHRLWTTRFGASRDAVGRTIRLDGHPHTIVGVLPPGARVRLPSGSADRAVLWKNPDRFWQNGDVWNGEGAALGILEGVARLRPDSDLARARSELLAVQERRRAELADYADTGFTFEVAPLHDTVVAEVRPTLWLLAGVAGTVLLIACANVTGLLLVRAQGRRRALSVRRALGASRRSLARLLLVESLLLAAVGAGVGLFVGWSGGEVLVALGPDLPRPASIVPDGRVLLFSLVVCLVVTVAVGVLPAIAASRSDPSEGLRGGRGSTSDPTDRVRGALVVAQLAVSVVLLVCAGLLGRSLVELRRVDPGFDPDGVLTFAVSLPGADYAWPEETGRFFVELERRLRQLEAVEHAGVMWPMPLHGNRWSAPFVAGEVDPEARLYAGLEVGTPGYFETLRIPLVEGRLFGSGDDPRAVVVVSRSAAERAWPGRSALGRTVRVNVWGGSEEPFEVIGVVEDVRHAGLDRDPGPRLYFDVRGWSWADWEFQVAVAGEGGLDRLLPPVRDVLASMDPGLPLADPLPLRTRVRRELANDRFVATIVALLGGIAALLAVLGLYGVVSYAAASRRREIGIRMALGARRSRILRIVLVRGAGLLLAGAGLGVLGASFASRLLESRLYRVEPLEPVLYAVMVLGLVSVAAVAIWIPARRAVRTDPMGVLRTE